MWSYKSDKVNSDNLIIETENYKVKKALQEDVQEK